MCSDYRSCNKYYSYVSNSKDCDRPCSHVVPQQSTDFRTGTSFPQIRDFRPVSDFAQVLAQVLTSGFSLRFQQVPHSEYILSRKNPNRLRFFLAARHSNGVVLCRSKRDDMQRSPSTCPVTKPPRTSQRAHGRKKSGALASVSSCSFWLPYSHFGFWFLHNKYVLDDVSFFSRRSDTGHAAVFRQQKIVATPHQNRG